MLTLTLNDEDLEYEWRLQEIHSRKTMVIISSLLCLLQDITWTLLLSDVDNTGKMIKLVCDILILISVVSVFFVPKVREIKETTEELK